MVIDESTGRMRKNSRWRDSIHEAVEAKEQIVQQLRIRDGQTESEEEEIEINPEDSTVASITFQVFFRYYNKLAGMTVRSF